MKWFCFDAANLLLSACSPEKERTSTVEELIADDAVLTKIIGERRNNLGKLRDTPNCRNAEAADGKLCLERMRKSLGG